MSKRFTDTNKYRKPFIRSLQGAYKLFWDYLYHDCDHAGIWIKDFEIAQIYVGADMPINEKDALTYFNNGKQRIIPFDNNEKWFIPKFIYFQYGELNEVNRAHKSVIDILKRYGLYEIYLNGLNKFLSKKDCKRLTRGLQGYKDKDKDMDMDKELLKKSQKKKL